MRWWHYTTGGTLLENHRERKDRTGTFVETDWRAAVWFSCRETWEPTATPGIEGSDRPDGPADGDDR